MCFLCKAEMSKHIFLEIGKECVTLGNRQSVASVATEVQHFGR